MICIIVPSLFNDDYGNICVLFFPISLCGVLVFASGLITVPQNTFRLGCCYVGVGWGGVGQ